MKRLSQKQIIILSIVTTLIFLFGSVILFMLSSTNSETTKQQDNQQQTQISDFQTLNYASYQSDKINNSKDNVLFFYANWSPSCQEFELNIRENSNQVDPKLNILKVDFDNDLKVRQDLKVNKECTFLLLDEEQNEIKRSTEIYSVKNLNQFVQMQDQVRDQTREVTANPENAVGSNITSMPTINSESDNPDN